MHEIYWPASVFNKAIYFESYNQRKWLIQESAFLLFYLAYDGFKCRTKSFKISVNFNKLCWSARFSCCELKLN